MDKLYVYSRGSAAPKCVRDWPGHVHAFLDQFVWTQHEIYWDLEGRPRIIIDMVGGTRTWIPLRPLVDPPAQFSEILRRVVAADL